MHGPINKCLNPFVLSANIFVFFVDFRTVSSKIASSKSPRSSLSKYLHVFKICIHLELYNFCISRSALELPQNNLLRDTKRSWFIISFCSSMDLPHSIKRILCDDNERLEAVVFHCMFLRADVFSNTLDKPPCFVFLSPIYNFGQNSGYPDWFCSLPPGKLRMFLFSNHKNSFDFGNGLEFDQTSRYVWTAADV